jgi:hypothetical protein
LAFTFRVQSDTDLFDATDLARDWPDDGLARRRRQLFPPRDPAGREPIEPSECDLNRILSDLARVAVIRE